RSPPRDRRRPRNHRGARAPSPCNRRTRRAAFLSKRTTRVITAPDELPRRARRSIDTRCTFVPAMRLDALFIYPIKSCAGIALERAQVTPRGLLHDRRWMIVDEQGRFL